MDLEKLNKSLAVLIFSFGIIVNTFGIISCYSTYPTFTTIRSVSYLCLISQVIFFTIMLVSKKSYAMFSFASTAVLGIVLTPMLIWSSPDFLKFLVCSLLISVSYGISIRDVKFTVIPVVNGIIYGIMCYEKTSLLFTIFFLLNWSFCNLTTTLFSILFKKYGKSMADSNKRLKKMAQRDELTCLYNRHFLQEMEIESSDEYIPIMMDIDNFKSVNDTYGHDEGDAVLQLLASILLRHSSPSFLIFRYGGEEFLVLSKMSEEATDKKAIELLMDIRRELKISSDKKPLTVSMGIGRKNIISDNSIKRADLNLYTSKKEGKNCISKNDVVFFS